MKSSTKLFLITTSLVVSFGALTASAEEEKSAAMRLLEVIDFTTTARANADASFEPVIEQMKAQGLPEEAIAEVKAAANKFFTKIFEDPEIKGEMAKVYESNFTKEEMEELLAFYATPVGKKSLISLPKIMQESTMIGQKFGAKHQAEFQSDMQAIMKKYQPAPEAGE